MRLVKLMIPMVLATAILGCSGTKQHKDASWTQKPASMNVFYGTCSFEQRKRF